MGLTRRTNTTARKLLTAAWVATAKPEGNWPKPKILTEDGGSIDEYKNQLARQLSPGRNVPENVKAGIEALRKAEAAGLNIGARHERLGI